MRQQIPLLLIFFCVVLFGCSKQEELPQQYSSYDFRMDGSRFVPNIGVPRTVTSLKIPTTIPSSAKGRDSMYYDFFPIAPTPLRTGSEYSFLLAEGTAQTSTIIAADEKTSKIFASIPYGGNITSILTDT